MEFSPDELSWHPLMQSAPLALQGRLEEAGVPAGQVLKLKPDLPERSRWFMRLYLKFDEMAEQNKEGSGKLSYAAGEGDRLR